MTAVGGVFEVDNATYCTAEDFMRGDGGRMRMQWGQANKRKRPLAATSMVAEQAETVDDLVYEDLRRL